MGTPDTGSSGSTDSSRVAVIGAGLAGMACAQRLRGAGVETVVLDRGRGPGGRTSTRRVELPDGHEVHFDHGAPYLHVHDEDFAQIVAQWRAEGACQAWAPSVVCCEHGVLAHKEPEPDLVVGVPTMNAICRHMGEGIPARYGQTVSALTHEQGSWRLEHIWQEDGIELTGEIGAQRVVLATSLPQAQRLIELHTLGDALGGPMPHTRTVWVCMLVLRAADFTLPDVIEVRDGGPLAMLVRDDAKPGRDRDESRSVWVLYAQEGWSARHRETPEKTVRKSLTDAFMALLNAHQHRTFSRGDVIYSLAHRWGHAGSEETIDAGCVYDASRGIGVCGDAFAGGRGGQSAVMSGRELADAVLASLA